MTKRPSVGTAKLSLNGCRKFCSFSSLLIEASPSREAAFSCSSVRKSEAWLASTAAAAGGSQMAQSNTMGARIVLARRFRTALLQGRRDRKSGVWGKSVSVRVDLGGCRIIKKKNNKNTQDGT